jgi:hypothetical protein
MKRPPNSEEPFHACIEENHTEDAAARMRTELSNLAANQMLREVCSRSGMVRLGLNDRVDNMHDAIRGGDVSLDNRCHVSVRILEHHLTIDN